jgi:hypothetical protein
LTVFHTHDDIRMNCSPENRAKPSSVHGRW